MRLPNESWEATVDAHGAVLIVGTATKRGWTCAVREHLDEKYVAIAHPDSLRLLLMKMADGLRAAWRAGP